jgi:hypothetical protein
MFNTDKESVLSTILKKWFDERVLYKNEMKKAYKSGNKELGDKFHMRQYTAENSIKFTLWCNSFGIFRLWNLNTVERIIRILTTIKL